MNEEENYKEKINVGSIFDIDEEIEENKEEFVEPVTGSDHATNFKHFVNNSMGNTEFVNFRIPISISIVESLEPFNLVEALKNERMFWEEYILEESISLRSSEYFFTKLTFMLSKCR